MLVSQLLLEMNISNLDDIKVAIDHTLFRFMDTGRNLPPEIAQHWGTLKTLLLKRLTKAVKNDEVGDIVTRQLLQGIPQDAPPWLETALARGDEVYQVRLKPNFATIVNHLIDWIAVDPMAMRIIKAAPEEQFLTNLNHAADTYFASKAAETSPGSTEEAGREVIMTFRAGPDQKIHHYMEHSLVPDDRGPVVAFWCKLTSAQALDREGHLMVHCVGSYCNDVMEGNKTIYSLRDMKNDPHATVEVQARQIISAYTPMKANKMTGVVNQIKGKGNNAPSGKYGPYIRDFLNEFGLQATGTAAHDLKGVGLLTFNGKYGTLMDFGGKIVTTFDNGDSIRIVDNDDKEEDAWIRANHRNNPTLDYLYVEKNGTHPFAFELTHAGQLEQVRHLRMIRKEPSRYPIFAKNLKGLFTAKWIAGSNRDTMEEIKLYYDAITQKWGSIEELTVPLLDYKGIKVGRFGLEAIFSVGSTVVATGRMDNDYSLFDLKTKKDNPALKYMPEVLKEYFKKYYKNVTDLSDSQKGLLKNYGIFSVKAGIVGVPEDRAIFKSKHGEVRAYSNRLYFYEPGSRLLGSVSGIGNQPITYHEGKRKVVYKITTSGINAIGDINKKALLQLVCDLSTDDRYFVDACSLKYDSGIHNLGFTVQDNILIPTSQVQFKTKVKGYTVELEPALSRLNLTIERPLTPEQRKALRDAKVTDKDIGDGMDHLISVSIDDHIADVRQRNRSSRETIIDHRVILAAALNRANTKMTKRAALINGLTVRNGKFYPQTDKDLINLARNHRIDLGNNFYFDFGSYSFFRSNKKDYDDYDTRFGTISHKVPDSEYSYGDSVVQLRWADRDKEEISFQMYKHAEVPRQAIIKAAAKFMGIFHAKIEPYLSSQYVGPAAGENDFEPKPSDDWT
jgi:hypothetical protein